MRSYNSFQCQQAKRNQAMLQHKRDSDRSLKLLIIGWSIAVLLSLAFWAGVAFIILHFVVKWW
jgi:hypothetical protein